MKTRLSKAFFISTPLKSSNLTFNLYSLLQIKFKLILSFFEVRRYT